MSEENELEQIEIEPEEVGLAGFEKKYKDQMRQIVTQKLDLPISTLPIMLDDQIKINPSFQRRDRWDDVRQSRLIESLLMNVPIPPVFLGEDDYGFYVVLDGRQRLTAIQNFLNNTLELKGLVVWDDLNGHRFQDLVKRGLDKHLTRRFLPAIVLLKESSSIVKYDVFDRLNTGGIKANEMEVRNAVFQGKFTMLLHTLSRDPIFCTAWNIPIDIIDAQSNSMYKEMIDLSMVLRFFAYSDPAKMNLPSKDYLSEFMKERNSIYDKNPNEESIDKRRFLQAITNSWDVFGADVFRNLAKTKNPPRSLPVAEAVMIALADYSEDQLTPVICERIRNAFNILCDDPVFQKSISAGTNGKGAIKTRVIQAKEVFASIILAR